MTEEEKKRRDQEEARVKQALEEFRAVGGAAPGSLTTGPDDTPEQKKAVEVRRQKYQDYINAILARRPTEEEMEEFREQARKIPDKLVGEDDD